ncbi:MAG: hypothetical protein HC817_01765 [Saprospiraceae bacterium]|nr:hypothetical protein [Saprospiraceae bacterium]
MTEKKLYTPEYIFFSLAFIFAVFIRIRFSDMAFERDEGEYAYAGAEILRGGFPYRDFYNMKLPGVYYFYALIFLIFGKNGSIGTARFSTNKSGKQSIYSKNRSKMV